MAAATATPLISLDAVVVDTETTGLDPRKARLLEIATVPLVGGRLDAAGGLRQLIDPGEPVPPAATRIHGIDDSRLAGAPRFAAVWPGIARELGPVLIGHTIGFDLAVLARECDRVGIAWAAPPALDTRLLGEIAEPSLADFSLESLADWLGVEIAGRHSASGDAHAAAQIFVALVPRLRDRNIRTLGEAIRACRALTRVLDEHHRAGWSDTLANAGTATERARVDADPYRHRVMTLMSPAQFIDPQATVGAALDAMIAARISSLFAGGCGPVRPEETGIVTERDILRALARDRAGALALPVTAVMSRPLATVPADAFAYLAISRMNRLKVRHLGVTDETGHVTGALSARDLLRLRAEGGIQLGDRIDQARDANDLAAAWGDLAGVAAGLVREGLSGREVAAVISRELGAMTHRAAVVAEQEMRAQGQGGPPCPYALAVLGSAGRGESLLAMDQDNAIVFAEGDPDGPEDRWFASLGAKVADILHAAGVPYCAGGVMARNAAWRGSLATWRARLDAWVARSDPRDLLAVDIFFDLRGVHGDGALAATLRREGLDGAAGNVAFAKLLVESAGTPAPALNWRGAFKTVNGRIDGKRSGLFAIVSVARALAVRHHAAAHATPARLAALKAHGGAADLEALIDAHATFLDLILAQQVRDIADGIPASNTIAVGILSRRDRARLRAAIEAVAHIEDLTRALMFPA